MKLFIPINGEFELYYPYDWVYMLNSGYIHQFQDNKGVGSLHISILGVEAKPTFAKLKYLHKNKINIGNNSVYEMPPSIDNKLNIRAWFFEIDNTCFLATYTYPTADKYSKKVEKELKSIYKIIGSIKIIKPPERLRRYQSYRFGKFLEGIATVDKLIERASLNGSFIECVCLLANHIDAFLRISIILNDQINNKNDDIDYKLIYQGSNDKPIFEKEIYRLALQKKVINQDIYDELSSAYNNRNKVVHRYIISEITTKEVLNIALKYSNIRANTYAIVDQLEQKQVDLSVGMTVSGPIVPRDIVENTTNIINTSIKEKHGGINFESR